VVTSSDGGIVGEKNALDGETGRENCAGKKTQEKKRGSGTLRVLKKCSGRRGDVIDAENSEHASFVEEGTWEE